jgi:hypothetical protein
MRRTTTLTLAALCVVLLPACPFSGKQSLARDAASELNLNSRFDRTQMVMEHVAAKERAEFTRSHHAWGGEVRVTDAEIAGFKMINPNEAEVQVHVAWFLLGEGELRSTVLRQKFEDDKKGHFLLVREERIEGDVGLLGERMETARPPAELAGPPPQFPTVKLGEND